MKIIILALTIVLSALQYRIWYGDSTYQDVQEVKSQIASQIKANAQLEKRNRQLKAEVYDLKHGVAVIEERARGQFGMIKQGEVFYQVIKDRPTQSF